MKTHIASGLLSKINTAMSMFTIAICDMVKDQLDFHIVLFHDKKHMK